MNKLAVIAVTAMAAFIGWCGYLAAHYQGGGNENKGLYAPNAFYRVRMPLPCPPACDQEQAIVAAATMRTDLQINGRKVVCIDPERHDMATALARAERNCTQIRR